MDRRSIGKYNHAAKGFLERRLAKIIEINRRYSKPKIKMTRMVRFSLLMLRLYLIFLVLLLAYAFITGSIRT